MTTLLAGAYRANITPPLGISIEGSFTPVFADVILDELWANALVLDDGANEFAILALDVCQMPTSVFNDIAREVEQRCGIPRSRLLCASSHTHNAASVGGVVIEHDDVSWDYVSQFVKRAATAVQMAQRRKQPAIVGAASATNPRHVFNRRLKRPDGSIVMNWFGRQALQGCVPAAPIDPEVGVIKIAALDRRPIAFIVNHANHNNAASVTKGAISADFSGVMAEALRRAYGDDVVTLFLPGAMGDINWIDPDTNHPRETLYREIGRSLAGSVMQCDYDMDYAGAGAVSMHTDVLHIAERPWDENKLSDLDVFQLEDHIERSPFYQAHQRWVAAGKPALQTIDVELRVLTLSDEIAIVSNPSEFFVELGMAVKAGSPFRHTLMSTLTNGNVGYVPTRLAFAEGGYETKKYPENSWLAEDAGDTMVRASIDLLRAAYDRAA